MGFTEQSLYCGTLEDLLRMKGQARKQLVANITKQTELAPQWIWIKQPVEDLTW